jgi:large-conductance mechanosensitive channel
MIQYKIIKTLVPTLLLCFLIFPGSVLAQNSDQAAGSGKIATLFGGLFALGFTFFWFAFVGLIMLINFLGIAFWIWMLIDCVKRDFKKENDKILWILVVALTGWIGALIYYFMIKRKEDKKV